MLPWLGRPMALELLLANATVTICHRKTAHLAHHVSHADVVIVATGVRDSVSIDWLKENQIIVDVGIHRDKNGKIRGDINFEGAKNIVGWITPVPGGVGPMTIVSLLENTLLASKLDVSSS